MGSCSFWGRSGSYSPAEADADTRLRRHLEELLEIEFDRSPELALRLHARHSNGSWTQRSADFAASEKLRLTKELLYLREAFDRGELGLDARLALRAQELAHERRLSLLDYRLERALLPDELAIFEDVARFLIEVHPLGSAEDASRWIALLRSLPQRFSEHAETLRAAQAVGLQPARAALDAACAQSADHWSARLLLYFERALLVLPELDADRRQGLLANARAAFAESVLPARAELEAVLTSLAAAALVDGALWRWPQGEAFYAHLLAGYGRGNLGAAELHRLAVTEVERYSEEIRGAMERAGLAESLDSYLGRLREQASATPELDEAGRLSLLERVQTLIDAEREACAALVDLELPRVRVRLREPAEFVGAGERLLWPELTRSKGEVLWVLDPGLPERFAEPRLEPWVHECTFPGALLALWCARQRPTFVRMAAVEASPLIEAWAAYVSNLGSAPEQLPSSAEELARLVMALSRASRLAADTGFHYKRWSSQRTLEYLLDHSADPLPSCQAVLQEILRRPGASTAAVLGTQKILEWRARATRRLGPRMDLPRFHGLLLSSTHLPLALVEQRIEAWIAAELP